MQLDHKGIISILSINILFIFNLHLDYRSKNIDTREKKDYKEQIILLGGVTDER